MYIYICIREDWSFVWKISCRSLLYTCVHTSNTDRRCDCSNTDQTIWPVSPKHVRAMVALVDTLAFGLWSHLRLAYDLRPLWNMNVLDWPWREASSPSMSEKTENLLRHKWTIERVRAVWLAFFLHSLCHGHLRILWHIEVLNLKIS